MIKATSETFRGQLEELAEASRTWCRKAFLTVTGEIMRADEVKGWPMAEKLLKIAAFADGSKVIRF